MNLSKLPGVEQCDVSYRDGKATLLFEDGQEPDVMKIKSTIADLGYQPGDATVRPKAN